MFSEKSSYSLRKCYPMPNNTPADIETLRNRYLELDTKRTQCKTLLERAESDLKELKRQAQEQFGTSDLEELKAKLAQMEEENLKMRRDYEALLDGIQTKLTEIERQPPTE